jgi:hypothetical protein
MLGSEYGWVGVIILIVIFSVIYSLLDNKNTAKPDTTPAAVPVVTPVVDKSGEVIAAKVEYLTPLMQPAYSTTYNPGLAKKGPLIPGVFAKKEYMLPQLYPEESRKLMIASTREHMFPVYKPKVEKALWNSIGKKEHMLPLYKPGKEKKLLNRLGNENMVNDMLYIEHVYNTLANPVKEHLDNGIPLYNPKKDIALLRSMSNM